MSETIHAQHEDRKRQDASVEVAAVEPATALAVMTNESRIDVLKNGNTPGNNTPGTNTPGSNTPLVVEPAEAVPDSAPPPTSPQAVESSPPAAVAAPTPESAVVQVTPSGCGCGGGGPSQLVYPLGWISYDFGTLANMDSFRQAMLGSQNTDPDPSSHKDMVDYLNDGHQYAATDLIWTLQQDATVLYAIKPSGAYAKDTYSQLIEILGLQQKPLDPSSEDDKLHVVQRTAVPGGLSGTAQLYDGSTVSNIVPDLRGLVSWATSWVATKLAKIHGDSAGGTDANTLIEQIGNFLQRIYYEFQNAGSAPGDRALNFAGTNAFEEGSAIFIMFEKGYVLNTISTQPSVLCRPDSDCWDIILTFFSPENVYELPQWQWRFTVDVSDVIPVSLGPIRSWQIP